jgi:hypothetical protein
MCQQISMNNSTRKYYGNPSVRIHPGTCGQTDMTEPLVASCPHGLFYGELFSERVKPAVDKLNKFLSYLRFFNVEQEGQCAYKRSIEARSRNHCCYGKTIINTYSECVSVALRIQYAMCERHIVINGLCVPYFSTLSHKQNDFWF